jgi:CAAX protease family protein
VADDVKAWGRSATIGLSILALFCGQFVALAALMAWAGESLTHWAAAAHDGVAVILIVCISIPVQVLILISLVKLKSASVVEYLGIVLPRMRDVVYGVIAILAFTVAANGVGSLIGWSNVTPFQSDIYRTASAAGLLTWLWLTMVLVSPIGEELLFRGFLFRGLLGGPGNALGAIIVTAFLWAIIHLQYELYFIGQVFLYGVILGWFRWSSGSTILTILLHAVANFEGLIETMISLRN